jgi:hypothetical protein
LANPNNSIQAKLGVIAMLEKVLSEANAYKGYMYLSLGPNNTPPEFGSEGWTSRKYF